MSNVRPRWLTPLRLRSFAKDDSTLDLIQKAINMCETLIGDLQERLARLDRQIAELRMALSKSESPGETRALKSELASLTGLRDALYAQIAEAFEQMQALQSAQEMAVDSVAPDVITALLDARKPYEDPASDTPDPVIDPAARPAPILGRTEDPKTVR